MVVTTAKHHLPNYGVFDEYRYFVPGNRLPVFRLPCEEPGKEADVAIAICEDLWQDGGPVTVTRQAGAGLLVVPNASPYERGKDAERLELCVNRAAEAGATLAYVNMMGGQDELVFDGDSIIVTAGGELLARGPQFEEALIVADLDLPNADLNIQPASEMITQCRFSGARPKGRIFSIPWCNSFSAVHGARMDTPRLSLTNSLIASTLPISIVVLGSTSSLRKNSFDNCAVALALR